MYFDHDFVYGGLMLGLFNLVTVAAIATAVVRVVLRQRAAENAFRLRMARWRHLTGTPAE